jgi:hypothetical protein
MLSSHSSTKWQTVWRGYNLNPLSHHSMVLYPLCTSVVHASTGPAPAALSLGAGSRVDSKLEHAAVCLFSMLQFACSIFRSQRVAHPCSMLAACSFARTLLQFACSMLLLLAHPCSLLAACCSIHGTVTPLRLAINHSCCTHTLLAAACNAPPQQLRCFRCPSAEAKLVVFMAELAWLIITQAGQVFRSDVTLLATGSLFTIMALWF